MFIVPYPRSLLLSVSDMTIPYAECGNIALPEARWNPSASNTKYLPESLGANATSKRATYHVTPWNGNTCPLSNHGIMLNIEPLNYKLPTYIAFDCELFLEDASRSLRNNLEKYRHTFSPPPFPPLHSELETSKLDNLHANVGNKDRLNIGRDSEVCPIDRHHRRTFGRSDIWADHTISHGMSRSLSHIV